MFPSVECYYLHIFISGELIPVAVMFVWSVTKENVWSYA